MRLHRSVVLTVVLLAGAAAWAQDTAAPAGPPPVMVISREEIKAGRMAIHNREGAAFVSVLDRANAKVHRVGLVPLSGDDNHVMYLQGYPSMGAFQAAQQELDQALGSAAFAADMAALEKQGIENHESQRTVIARYRADLSYRPPTPEQVGRTRFVNMQVIRVKPGRVPDYVELLKTLNEARAKAAVEDLGFAVYWVSSGAPAGTFFILAGGRELAEMDAVYAATPARQKKIDEALGGAEAARQQRIAYSEVVVDVTNTLYAMNPEISRPIPAMMAADPEFWSRKPAAAEKALAAKKEKK